MKTIDFLLLPLTIVRGVGSKASDLYGRLLNKNKPKVIDLLLHKPERVVFRRKNPSLMNVMSGDIITAEVIVDEIIEPKTKSQPLKIRCCNDTGYIYLSYFKTFPGLIEKNFVVGKKIFVSGKAERFFNNELSIIHPDIGLSELPGHEVVYPLTMGLNNKFLGQSIRNALEKVTEMPEWLSKDFLLEKGWESWLESIKKMHFFYEQSRYVDTSDRLAFDELLSNQIALGVVREKIKNIGAKTPLIKYGNFKDVFLKKLPFELTGDQKKVVSEIENDIFSPKRMLRLLQGDVGSGKTVVAFLTMLPFVENKKQVALMVPTSILATQHYEWIKKIVNGYDKIVNGCHNSTLEGKSNHVSGLVGGIKSVERLYSTQTLARAQNLRKQTNSCENFLWNFLRNKRMDGFKFKRQQPIDKYVADFINFETKIIIEVDGQQHYNNYKSVKHDLKRDEVLNNLGYKVLRFWAGDVYNNINNVLETIYNELHLKTPHQNTSCFDSPSRVELEHPIAIELLTGKIKGKKREDILKRLENGEIDILIGTHAIFQENIKFKNLGYVVIDEQHRFGVSQRLNLIEKAENVDVLVMTATPIPRTLSLTIYGDMEVSAIKEKPKNRKEIITTSLHCDNFESLVDRIKNMMQKGEKIYWICPLIDESEALEATPLFKRYQELSESFGDECVGFIHGKMKEEEKDKIMEEFSSRDGAKKILIATTVIEVGIDVPDATVIIIENPERFGLAQMHQLRGRVGRGDKQSYCILFFQKFSQNLKKRMEILKSSSDGFEIAEEDLKMRGSGEILGFKQSGMPDYRIADLSRHYDLLIEAAKMARNIVQNKELLNSEAVQTLLKLYGYGDVNYGENILN